ncbi:MAG TPA: alpha/beta hydrolase, partial [Alteromonas sp.]|nr:alpha/beta hydrolase [Alteromonas sp.]
MKACEFTISSGTIRGMTNGQQGQIVLALHGFLENAASMACLAASMSQYQYIAIDLPGHGLSDHRPTGAH